MRLRGSGARATGSRSRRRSPTARARELTPDASARRDAEFGAAAAVDPDAVARRCPTCGPRCRATARSGCTSCASRMRPVGQKLYCVLPAFADDVARAARRRVPAGTPCGSRSPRRIRRSPRCRSRASPSSGPRCTASATSAAPSSRRRSSSASGRTPAGSRGSRTRRTAPPGGGRAAGGSPGTRTGPRSRRTPRRRAGRNPSCGPRRTRCASAARRAARASTPLGRRAEVVLVVAAFALDHVCARHVGRERAARSRRYAAMAIVHEARVHV